ncbi:MoxR family ATPase [Microbacterium sp. MPKO10]|uniref:AAA family ATPase n=1 Tax=Microbacterium sp. MPKO10 TaxID=2989818 RepID=UPI0022362DC4|nr:MoxR family ATPase [Microbacterium sp. MPKO10]MCW4457532.1 MoxR family ATPase [Microbacterium sp. MPKO10]
MDITQEQADWFKDAFTSLVDNVDKAIVGKQEVIRLVIASLLTGGHVLLEDYPGTGKTVLAKSLANTLEGASSRIQFTPDLLPSDVTGVTIYNQQTHVFEFHKGPIFAQIVLADEINRASPKTQSALLEVMEEGLVTVDNETHPVGSPFMVIATQNPVEQSGTYKLPEAQLDRFLIKTSLGYPDRDTSVNLLMDAANRSRSAGVGPIINAESVNAMTKLAGDVHVERSIMEYITDIIHATRSDKDVALGVSMRGGLALARIVKVWALSQGRTYATPDDVNALAVHVLAHRLLIDPESEFAGVTAHEIIDRILLSITPPAYRAA